MQRFVLILAVIITMLPCEGAAQVSSGTVDSLVAFRYPTLTSRRHFYLNADRAMRLTGCEVRWMRAAAKTVAVLHRALYPEAQWMGMSNAEIRHFIHAGSKAILTDMMPRVHRLTIMSKPLMGADAQAWDMQTLADEQALIQPYYEALSAASRAILQHNLEWKYGFDGNIIKPADRWALGMQMMGYERMTADRMPVAGR